ncbi:MAG: hypothetical protein KatS3mg026_0991 [Bacteroidia bacterium]|nr:MAG: hypothetical protein KatS3mg026_0991 [Bacteroidia bacterium]
MRRKWLILFGVVIGVGALVWVWFWGSVDFRVEGPKEGLLPGTRLVTIVLKKPLSEAVELSEAPFAVEPGVPVVGWQRAGAERVFLLLGQPLQAGQRYTVRALPSSGLSGQVKVQVQPLTLTVAPVAYWGAEGTPALLLQANGELSVDRLSTVIRLHSPEKKRDSLPSGKSIAARSASGAGGAGGESGGASHPGGFVLGAGSAAILVRYATL